MNNNPDLKLFFNIIKDQWTFIFWDHILFILVKKTGPDMITYLVRINWALHYPTIFSYVSFQNLSINAMEWFPKVSAAVLKEKSNT